MNDDYELAVFCRNVCYLRLSHNYTKKKMAEILGISVRSLNRIEAGEVPHCVKYTILYRIYDAFHVLSETMYYTLLEEENKTGAE